MEYHYEIIPTSELPAAMTAPVQRAYDLCMQYWGITPALHFISPCRAEADLSNEHRINGLATANGNLYVKLQGTESMVSTLFHEFRHHVQYEKDIAIKQVHQQLEEDATRYAANCTQPFINKFNELCSRATKATEQYFTDNPTNNRNKNIYIMKALRKSLDLVRAVNRQLERNLPAATKREILKMKKGILEDIEQHAQGADLDVFDDPAKNKEGVITEKLIDTLLSTDVSRDAKDQILNMIEPDLQPELHRNLVDVSHLNDTFDTEVITRKG